jgi:hypothetical protein
MKILTHMGLKIDDEKRKKNKKRGVEALHTP